MFSAVCCYKCHSFSFNNDLHGDAGCWVEPINQRSSDHPFPMAPKAKAAGKGRAPAKRKLAEEFPPGEVLTDTGKKSWKLGVPIGKGGFGLIYLAEQNTEKPVGPDARYVIKVVRLIMVASLRCCQHFCVT
ncbi:hypothetical protein XENORESO_010427 [Xenotaenia resolanae]|uniref:Uncharacterized protein n=1 Tax=Xenotaenia resolanae TaxID=208358 RepID=A0ABV0W258_9TELE